MAAHAREPFARTNSYTIPDVIFEQYNRVTSYTLMGLFPEIRQAWVTVDNRLYMWDYATQAGFRGYEDQPNTISAVRMLKPKPGTRGRGEAIRRSANGPYRCVSNQRGLHYRRGHDG